MASWRIPVQNLLIKGGIQREYLQEVRLRAGSPLFLRYQNREISLNRDGQPCRDWKDAYRIRMEECAGDAGISVRILHVRF